ncbi:MAG: hypothetical protein CMK59_06030 [Proteobacteria bacterium]|nr:hypothetical protein [Pseudomonadota bacterium]
MSKREQNKAEKRSAILDAAWHFFITLGYDNTSVVLIVDRAGIARGTFYQYYKDKEQLFDHLLESLYQPLIEILEMALNDLKFHGSNPQAQQQRSVRTAILLAKHLEDRKSQWPLHFRTAWSAGYAGDSVRKWRSKIESLAHKLLSGAQSYGLLRQVHSQMTIFAFVGACERLIWAWLNEEIELSRRELAQQMALLFWQGLLPEHTKPSGS